jgi:hypothetical protein
MENATPPTPKGRVSVAKITMMNREQAIESLLTQVEEVIGNGDWPTEAGHFVDDGVTCTCPIQKLVDIIRGGLHGE